AVKGGEIVVDGVNYTIEQAKAQQLRAYLCGAASFGEVFTQVDFWSLNAVQQKSPGINCDNFAQHVTSAEQLKGLEDIWKGYYTQQLVEIGGPQNKAEITTILQAGWSALERDWKLYWTAKAYDDLRAELARQAKAAAENPGCASQTTTAGGSAASG